MAPYRVNLEIFAGPLDLLLYLIRKDEVDVYDIEITKITDQYIKYIDLLKSLDIDLAGDFLVMAATLMQIKSAMLLPKADPEMIEDEEFNDPRAELIRQLLEYKKFKDAANLLKDAVEEQREKFPRPNTLVRNLKPTSEVEIDIDQVSVWDLLEAFDNIMQATGASYDMSHISDDTPIDFYQIEILHRLQSEGPMTFERIFEGKENRAAMIGLFLAMLELIRNELIWGQQDESTKAIFIKPLTDEPAEVAVQKAIMATEAENGQDEISDAEEETQEDQLPIPVEEIHAEPTRPTPVVSEDGNIPIVELPAQKKDSSEPSEISQQGEHQISEDT